MASAIDATPVRSVLVDEDAFPCLDIGEGEPVLFLHGAVGDLRTWERQCEALSDRYRCMAYTQRWFGPVPWRPNGPPFGTTAHAGDLIAFVEAVGAGPVSLVAWSYAGHVAFEAALAHPDLFQRILVFEPGVPTYVEDPAERAAFGVEARQAFGPVSAALAAGDLREAVRRLIDASGGEGSFDGQAASCSAIEIDNAHTLPMLFGQTPPRAITAVDLATLAVPVSIAWGARTRPIYRIPSQAAARAIGGAAHWEIPEAGHLWPDHEPEAFAAFVGAWLEEPRH
ncbi:alpha/beta fold hydrolase [Microvirga pudoricolor]|uniref:alpha/beta fold hydrolase n=1 Tax=Microvirga pudoricolor TaxID=2778729 RepID=UPI001952013C|nr:alpha/beta hydrolase [Microvirga pudoricolor]MBM6595880.1 alpha/beta hydrolase [Microvirga pudoricolor]